MKYLTVHRWFGTEEFLKIIKYVIQDANVFVISHKTGLDEKV